MTPGQNTVATILLVQLSKDDSAALRQILGNSSCDLREAADWREACAFLDGNCVHVIVCNCHPSSGEWRDFAKHIAGLPAPPVLLAASRLADESLWAEVLNLGGYDLLASPLDAGEARRAIYSAWHAWESERHSQSLSVDKSVLAESESDFGGVRAIHKQ
jgi:DNA-binding NtrC family response regulator